MILKGETFFSLLVVLLGLGAIWAGSVYEIGDVSRMGPGFIPTALGVVLVGLGAILVTQSFSAPRVEEQLPWRVLLAVGAGILAFTFGIENLGLVPSVFLLVILSVCGINLGWWKHALGVSAAMSVIAYLIFIKGLSVPVSAFWW